MRLDPESGPVHATAVALGGRGLLISGASGSGKSGLAMRLICLGAHLVADDRVILEREPEGLRMRAPKPILGMIEARGFGLLAVPTTEAAPVSLIVDLDAKPAARLPEPAAIDVRGALVPLIAGKEVPNLDAALILWLRHGWADRNTTA